MTSDHPPLRPGYVLACCLVALIVMLPEFVWGTSYSYSFRYNIVWAQQMGAQMGAGEIYPRWLDASWDGLGAPTFYFYAPAYFLTAGGFAAFLPLSAAIAAASAAFIAASGVTMERWLSRITAPRISAIGGILWMMTPYHLHEIYTRGALAEASIYAALPLVLAGLHDMKTRPTGGVLLLGAGFGAAILSHVPVALLATVTLFIGWGLFCAWQDRQFAAATLAKGLAGAALGIGLSAAFLLPALLLLPHISADQLSTPAYAPEGSFFFTGPGSLFGTQLADNQLVSIALATGYLFLSVLLVLPGQKPQARLFGAVGIACFLIVSGLMPFFWDIPLFRQVQFPARILPVMELAVLSGLAAGFLTLSRRSALLAAIPVVFGLALVFNMGSFRMKMAHEQGAEARRIVLADKRDAPEYLPHGHAVGFDDKGRADPSAVPLPPPPLALADQPGVKIAGVASRPEGGVTIRIETPVATRLSVRRFHFPRWEVIDAGSDRRIVPEPDELKRVSWLVSAGSHSYTLRPVRAPHERTGWIITLGSLILLSIGLVLARWRRS